MKKLLFLLLFAGTLFARDYRAQIVKREANEARAFQTVAAADTATSLLTKSIEIGEYAFFSLQMTISGSNIDIDSVVIEVGLAPDTSNFVRALDANESITWAVVFTATTTGVAQMASFAPPPSRFMRIRTFTGQTAAPNYTITYIVGRFP